MSSSFEAFSSTPSLLQPQARRLDVAARVAPAPTNGKMPSFKGEYQPVEERASSGTATPIPNDAPPSVQATSSARQALRAQHKKRLFPTVEYTPRVSHFDPQSEHRDFRGFFVLFWIGLAIMVVSAALRNVKETGYPFRLRQRELFTADFWEMAISDMIMCLSTMLCLPLHNLYAAGGKKWLFRWSRGGVWIQSVFQAIWLFYWIDLPFHRGWSWTAQVFLTLHVLSVFMKLHSYSFYMGHLNETRRQLNELDRAKSIPRRRKIVRYPSAAGVLQEIHPDALHETEKSPEKQLTELREDLATELTSPLGNVTYPQNMTYTNFMDYLCCPTLCYELEYPRLERRRWSELFYKTIAVFGCVFLLTLVAEEFIIPVLDEAAIRMQATTEVTDFLLLLAETISTMLFPFMVCFLLVFLVIFEYICGAFAEITRFADRHFYDDWWNTTDWLGFSREWNIPVHNFFRRHVYLAIQSSVGKPSAVTGRAPRYSRALATGVTFFISAIAHELILGCITKKLRGYGLIAMMLQIPLVTIQRSPPMRNRKLLNNVLFWISMILGLSMMIRGCGSRSNVDVFNQHVLCMSLRISRRSASYVEPDTAA